MFEITYFDEVTSTNDIIKEAARNGAKEWTVAIANSQSAGRGRMGKSFMSPRGTGIYMSILLRPTLDAENALLITTAAAVAVAKVIEAHTAKKASIKWVNDVFVDGKKVCGILTEGQLTDNGKFDYAILGIGINLTVPKGGFMEIENIAGALFENCDYDKNKIIDDILNCFAAYYEKITDKPHFEDYAKRDMLCGKVVNVIRAGEVLYSATVCGIDRDFSLVIEHDGKKENLATGEVSVKAI